MDFAMKAKIGSAVAIVIVVALVGVVGNCDKPTNSRSRNTIVEG